MKNQEKFPTEIFKAKLKVGNKYRHITWNIEEWVKVLYIGNKYFFSSDYQGKEDYWLIDQEWISCEEEPEKKPKLEVGKKYRKEGWESHKWVKVLYIGENFFFAVDEKGKKDGNRVKDGWLIDDDWLPYEEEPEKEFKDYQKFYVLDCGILRVVYAESLEGILANCVLIDKVYTEKEVIEKGLKI